MKTVIHVSRAMLQRATPTRWVRQYIYLLGALLLLVSGTAVGALRTEANQIDRLNDIIGPAMDANYQVFKAMNDAQSGLLGYQASNDRNLLMPYRGAYVRTISALDALEASLALLIVNNIVDNSAEAGLEARHRQAVREWWAFAQSKEAEVLSGKKIDVLQAGVLFESFRRENAVVREYLRTERDQAQSTGRTIAAIGLAVTIAAALVALLAIILLGWQFSRRVSQPLIHLRQTMRRQQEGDSAARAREDQGSTEIRSLAFDFNSLAEANLNAQRRAEDSKTHMAGLVDLSLTLNQELSLNDLLVQIVESAHQMFGARYAALGVLDGARTGLAKFMTAGLSPEERAAIGELPIGMGLLGAIIHDPQILRLEHMADDPRSVGFPPHHPPMDSFLGVPIFVHGEIYGNLYLTDKVGGLFTAEDEQVAYAFALQAAVAVENVLRYEVEHQRSNMLESVREIEHAVRTAPDTQHALDILCAVLGERLDCDRVIAKVGDSDDKLLASAQWHLQSVGDLSDDLVPYIGPLAKELWRSSETLVVNDFLASQQLSQRDQIFHGYTDARAAIIVPIGLGERVIGVIYAIMVNQARHWTEFEINAVQQVTAFVARVIVEAEFRANQSEHIELLKRLERQKSNFVATVSHELRTPLTSIIGYLELLQDTKAGELTGEQHEMLEAMDRNANRLRSLIEDLLLLNQRESDGLKVNVADVAICEIVTEICLELSPIAQSRSIEIDLTPGPKMAIVLGDRMQLHGAIINIVSNAIKFSRPGDVVTIRCIVDEDTRRVKLTCQDRGIGIPSDDQAQLFTRFFRASNATREMVPGSGLGLSIVKQIVEDHGGEVRLTSLEGEGTTVVIDLPLSTNTILR